MAIYRPPQTIKVSCNRCGYECEKTVPHNYLPDCKNRAQWNCPKCGYFTLRDSSMDKLLSELKLKALAKQGDSDE